MNTMFLSKPWTGFMNVYANADGIITYGGEAWLTRDHANEASKLIPGMKLQYRIRITKVKQ